MNVIPKTVVTIAILCSGLTSAAFGDDIASLIEQLGDRNKNKAKKASDELAAMGEPAVPELIKALSSKDRRRGRFAARALRQIGQDAADAIPVLSESLKDSDALTREYAIEALGKMVDQADRVIPVLTEATNDRDKDVRDQAKIAIVRLTEMIKSKEQGGPTQQPLATASSPKVATQSTGTTDVIQSEPLQPNGTDVNHSSAAPGAHSPQKWGYLGEHRLMVLIRCALLASVVAGFFSLLYLYREAL
ncbi:MAG: HEAT repeat domain-containing protein [Planctomycetota bacterium]|jgi:flagellar hook-length control protein FliK